MFRPGMFSFDRSFVWAARGHGLALILTSLACTPTAGTCQSGTESCACIEGACLPGLDCRSGLCVDLSETTDDGTTDGDPPPDDADACERWVAAGLCDGYDVSSLVDCDDFSSWPCSLDEYFECLTERASCVDGQVDPSGWTACADLLQCGAASTTNATSNDDGPGGDGSTSSIDDGPPSDDGMFIGSDEGSDDAFPGDLPDGAGCTDDSNCASGHCYVLGSLGGTCGECTSDADCGDGGCSPPDLAGGDGLGSRCNNGQLGGGCQTDAACQGSLVCADVWEVPGVLTVRTCSECETDDDCGAERCTPDYDPASFDGARRCVPSNSLPHGETCDLLGSGDQACAGYCSAATVAGYEFGFCGACEPRSDLGCSNGDSCQPPELDPSGDLTPAVCI